MSRKKKSAKTTRVLISGKKKLELVANVVLSVIDCLCVLQGEDWKTWQKRQEGWVPPDSSSSSSRIICHQWVVFRVNQTGKRPRTKELLQSLVTTTDKVEHQPSKLTLVYRSMPVKNIRCWLPGKASAGHLNPPASTCLSSKSPTMRFSFVSELRITKRLAFGYNVRAFSQEDSKCTQI